MIKFNKKIFPKRISLYLYLIYINIIAWFNVMCKDLIFNAFLIHMWGRGTPYPLLFSIISNHAISVNLYYTYYQILPNPD